MHHVRENVTDFTARLWMRSACGDYVRRMNPGLRLFLDLGPLIVFFVSYYAFGLLPATGVFMVATIAAAAVSYVMEKKIPPLMIFSGLFVVVLGGLTLWLKDGTFIKMKPTIYYLTVSSILFGTLF